MQLLPLTPSGFTIAFSLQNYQSCKGSTKRPWGEIPTSAEGHVVISEAILKTKGQEVILYLDYWWEFDHLE